MFVEVFTLELPLLEEPEDLEELELEELEDGVEDEEDEEDFGIVVVFPVPESWPETVTLPSLLRIIAMRLIHRRFL